MKGQDEVSGGELGDKTMNEPHSQDDPDLPDMPVFLPTLGEHGQRAYRQYVATASAIIAIFCFVMAVGNSAAGETLSGIIWGLISLGLLKFVWMIRNREDWWDGDDCETEETR